MNRVFQIVEYGQSTPYQFISKATSTVGVFRSFSKNHVDYLKPGTMYSLYGAVNYGFQKIAAAFYNGNAFVRVSTKVENTELVNEFLNANKDFVL